MPERPSYQVGCQDPLLGAAVGDLSSRLLKGKERLRTRVFSGCRRGASDFFDVMGSMVRGLGQRGATGRARVLPFIEILLIRACVGFHYSL